MTYSESGFESGVSRTDAQKYSGSEFVCDGGSRHAISIVNDDYCDCTDGTDEPGMGCDICLVILRPH